MAVEIELIGDSTQLLNSLRQINEDQEEIKKSNNDIEKSFKDTFDKSANEVDKTNRALKDQVKTQEKVERNVEMVQKEFTELERKKKKAFDDKEVKDFNKELDKTGDKVDDIGDAEEKVGGLFGGLSEGLDDVKDGFANIGSEIVGSGGGGGIVGGLGQVLSRLGPVGIAVAGIVASIFAIGAAVVSVDQKFDTLRGTINQLTGETGDGLDSIAISLAAIEDTFGIETTESLQAVNVLMKEFGISAQEATGLLEKGLLSNANIQGDLIDSVREYSTQVRAAGGDADDLFTILQSSGTEGVFSDKGIDAVKEFGLRIREQADATTAALETAFGKEFADRISQGISDGSLTSIEALQLVSAELGTLDESSKEAQAVIADVFGGAGEDAGFRFLTTLKDINSEQGFTIDGANELTEAQQKNLDANKRLAEVQNELSKSIGDSSAVGRVWTEIQIGFFEVIVNVVEFVNKLIEGFELLATDPIEGLKVLGAAIFDLLIAPLNLAIDALNFIPSLFGFDDVIPQIGSISDATKEWNNQELIRIDIGQKAIEVIRQYDAEAKRRIGLMRDEFDVLESTTKSEEEKRAAIERLNETYPELLENIDLENASSEELVTIKNNLTRAILEEDIARKKKIATQQLDLEIQKRERQLQAATTDAERKRIEDEILFLQTKGKERLDQVENEVKLQLGLIERGGDEIADQEEENQNKRTSAAKDGADERKKIEDDFQKSVEELLKRGQNAFLNDQTVSEQERLLRQRDFQLEELNQLFDHIKELNETLNDGKELDIGIIEAFNAEQERIVLEFNDKIREIERAENEKRRQEAIANRQALLDIDQEAFQIRSDFLQAQLDEELALIEQSQRREGESERQFEIRKQQDILDAQQFYADRRIELIQQEQQLKLDAIDQELLAIADKEGIEYELKRQNLEDKKKLIEQETQTQLEQFNLQKQGFQQQLDELSGADTRTLGDFFAGIQDQLQEAFNLDSAQLKAIGDAVSQVGKQIFDTIKNSLSEQLSAQDELLDKLGERVDEAEASLDREIELNKQGFASNVELKRQELDAIKFQEQKAAAERAELVKKQQRLETIEQTASLITASANIFKSLSVLPFGVGIPIAAGLIGTMFALFIAQKRKAADITKLAEGGSGDDRGVISGRRHKDGGERFLDHVEVEGGESWGVLSRNATRKFQGQFHDFVKYANQDNMDAFNRIYLKKDVPKMILKKKQVAETIQMEINTSILADEIGGDLKKLHSIDETLKKTYKKPDIQTYEKGGKIYRIETYPNGSKKTIITE